MIVDNTITRVYFPIPFPFPIPFSFPFPHRTSFFFFSHSGRTHYFHFFLSTLLSSLKYYEGFAGRIIVRPRVVDIRAS